MGGLNFFMERYDIYKDIAGRTGGDIYIGVVGPVRTGKSTFISRFMDKMVLPKISGKNKKKIAQDELPQSAEGKTVMTTEPKFVPSEGVNIPQRKKRTAQPVRVVLSFYSFLLYIATPFSVIADVQRGCSDGHLPRRDARGGMKTRIIYENF